MSSTTTRTPETDSTLTSGTMRPLRAVLDLPAKAFAEHARTDAEDKLWTALHANPGSSAADLAATAGIGKSTAGKILAKWEKDVSVRRSAGTVDGARRTADTWKVIEADDTSSFQPSEPEADMAAPDSGSAEPDVIDNGSTNSQADPNTTPAGVVEVDAAPGDTSTAGGEKKERLAPGTLRGMVEDYLRDHPGDEFSPSAIAKALGGKSSGAVSNALDKLVKEKTAVKTKDSPKRFALSPDDGQIASN